jgi:serine/threonine protein kinase
MSRIGSLSGNGSVYDNGDGYITKVLKKNHLKNFINEVKLHTIASNHDLSPKIIRSDSKKGSIVMEKMHTTLSDLLNTIKYDPDEMEQVAQKVYHLVETLHSLGIFHNDLHTDNIMIDSNGTLKLIDFGDASTDPNPNEYDALLNSDFALFNESFKKYIK